MTPAARWQAAIEILDRIGGGGLAVEEALTRWARGARFAGSKDRAAVRDIVYDVTRRRRSAAWVGGGDDGRALALGALRLEDADADIVFSGARYAPDPLSGAERGAGHALEAAPRAVRLDMQDWILPLLDAALGDAADPVAEALRHRAPVGVRANLRKASREEVLAALTGAGMKARAHPLSPTAVDVTGPARGLATLPAFTDGLFEFQDPASQAVVDRLAGGTGDGLRGARVLDYCAGGGGKALAMAAHGAKVTAHDASPERMRDLPARAARAGADIAIETAPEGTFDLVVCDAPCSGSGAWRRQPEAKWRLTEARLADLTAIQDTILDEAVSHVRPGGRLAYATCSLLAEENGERADAFLARHPGWVERDRLALTPLDGGDGFFLAVFQRA